MTTESIAVIDDGVDTGLFGLGRLAFDIEVDSNLQVTVRLEQKLFLPSHGTTCAAIIKKYAEEACIGSIKILNDTNKKAMKYQLIKALYWCAQNSVRLTHLSLGTIDFRDFDEIKECINDVTRQGLIVVAACNNRNVYTLPACLHNVIGVRCRQIYTDGQYKFHPHAFDGVDISASGRHFITDAYDNSRYTNPSNSFAAPMITARVHNMLKDEPGLSPEKIKKNLYRDALNDASGFYNPFICMNTDWMECCQEIDTDSFNENCTDNSDIREWDKADTVVLSSCRDNSLEIQSLNKILEAAKRQHKNVVCLQEGLSEKDYAFSQQEGIRIWDRSLYRHRLEALLSSGKGEEVEIPVIVIYDPENYGVLDIVNSLFKKDGYYSVRVSMNCRDILQGCEYLPDISGTEEFMSMVYRKYDCDVILLLVNNEAWGQMGSFKADIKLVAGWDDCTDNENADYKIVDSTDTVFININGQQERQRLQIEEAYNSILSLFCQQHSMGY